MKWIGQHIWDLTSRFRNDIYFEGLAETAETRGLVVDANGKVSINPLSGDEHATYIYENVRNDEGATIPAGTPVYSKGEIGGSERIKVGIAKASDPNRMPAIGVTNTQLTATGSTRDGLATLVGVYNTNITGFTDLSINDIVYVAPDGGLTTSKPAGTNLIQNVGIILKTNGTIIQGLQVTCIGRTNDVPNVIKFRDEDGVDNTSIQYSNNDISTWQLQPESFTVSAQEATPEAVFFKPDGTKMYILGRSGDDVGEYALSTAWDISTATYTDALTGLGSSPTGEPNPYGMYISPDGIYLYITGHSVDEVAQYTMSTAWDISTASYTRKQDLTDAGGTFSNPTGIHFKPDGTMFWACSYDEDSIQQYTLSTAWDVSTLSVGHSFSLIDFFILNDFSGTANADLGSVEDLFFSEDGTKVWLVENAYDSVHQLKLSTAWDIRTAAYDGKGIRHTAFESVVEGIYVNETAGKAFTVSSSSDRVRSFNLGGAVFSSANDASIGFDSGIGVKGNASFSGTTSFVDVTAQSSYVYGTFATYSTTNLTHGNGGSVNILDGSVYSGDAIFDVMTNVLWGANGSDVSVQDDYQHHINLGRPKGGAKVTLNIGRKVDGSGNIWNHEGVVDIVSMAQTFDHYGSLDVGRTLQVDGKADLEVFDLGGTVVFNDTFTETNTTAIESHTPDLGAGWTKVFDTGSTTTFNIIGGAGYGQLSNSETSDGVMFLADTTPTGVDYEVRVDFKRRDSGDDVFHIIIKYQDANNYYALSWSTSYSNTYCKLYRVESGTVVKIDNGFGNGVMNSTSDNLSTALKLRFIDNTLMVWDIDSSDNKAFRGSFPVTTDFNDGNGGTYHKVGMAFGDLFGGGLDATATWKIDKFEVKMLSSAATFAAATKSYVDAGNFGVGITNPTSKFHVVGDARIQGNLTVNGTYTQIDTDVNTTEQWLVTNDGTGPAAVINQKGSEDIFDVQDDGTSVFYIKDGGNIGIGTTSPTANLEIGSDGAGEKTLKIHSDTANSYFEIESLGNIARLKATNNTNFMLRSDGGGGYITNWTNGAERMRITSAGNVGIGTASPGYRFVVNSYSADTVAKFESTDSIARLELKDDDDAAYVGTQNNKAFIGMEANATGTNNLIVTSDGNVGIGTTNPTAPLHIETADDAVIRLTSTDNKSYIALSDNDTNGYISSENSRLSLGANTGVNANNLNIDLSNNNIGIGTSSPGELFEVYKNGGDVAIKVHEDAGTHEAKIHLRRGGSDWELINNNDLAIESEGTELFRIKTSGNVGIGTSSPAEALEVAGSIKAGSIKIQNANGGRIGFNRNTSNGTIYNNSYGAFQLQNNGAGYLELQAYNSSGGFTGRLTMLESNGNIGIGTTSPSEKLEVDGNITVSGTVDGVDIGANYANWNTAYSWGNHASAGYLTSSSTQSKYLRSDAVDYFTGKLNWDGADYTDGINMSLGNIRDAHRIDANEYFQRASGRPRNNLGDPTVTEMALFEEQFKPQTTLANDYDDLTDLTFWSQETSSSSWVEVTSYSDDQKRKFLRTNNSSVIIPNSYYKFRVEFNAKNYTFANAMYMYWSSQSHKTQIQVWKYNVLNDEWTQHTTSTQEISSWPGHGYLPFSKIAWHETNTTSSSHFKKIRFEFTPNWIPYSGSGTDYSTRNINLHGMQIWGGYPSGRRTPHYYDQNGEFNFLKDAHILDSYKLNVGTGNDLQIYHDGSNSYIDETGTGNLVIRANSQLVVQKYTGETMFKGIADGAFEAYHNNVKMLETTSTGVDVLGNIVSEDTYPSVYVNHGGTLLGGIRADATNKLELKTLTTAPLSFQVNSSEKMRVTNDGNVGIGTTNPSEKLDIVGNIRIGDNDRIKIGNGGDMYLQHDGTNSVLVNTNGNLTISNQADDGDVKFSSDDGSGGVAEYFRLDGALGYTRFWKHARLEDNVELRVGTGNDLRFTHTGTGSYIDNYTGNLSIRNFADDSDILFQSDDGSGGVETYFYLDGSNGLTTFPDNKKLGFGNASDLRIYHDGTNNYIQGVNGDLYIQNGANDKDIILRSDDGSGGQTAYLTLDGSAGYTVADKDIYLADDVRLRAGTGGDFSFFHDGSNSKINNNTGNIRIENFQDDGDIQFFTDDSSGGTTEYFRVDGGDHSVTFSKEIKIASDNHKLTIGAARDLQLYHNGTDSVVESYVGDFYISQKAADKDLIFRADDGAGGFATYFYLDGSAASSDYYYTRFGDKSSITFGDGNDLRIYHDSTDSSIENENGHLYIQQKADDKDIIFRCDDGSGGVTPYLTLDGSDSKVVVGKQLSIAGDNRKLTIGTSDDLQLYHNGTDTAIDNNTGDLYISNYQDDGDIIFRTDDGSGGHTQYFRLDGGDESIKFYKDISNQANANLVMGGGQIKFSDAGRFYAGDSNDLQIYHDGSNSYIVDAGTGDLLNYFSNEWKVIKYGSSETCIEATSDGSVDLYYDNSKKLETTSTGVDITGNVAADTFVSIQGVDTGNPNAGTDELRVSGYGILGNRSSGVYVTNENSSGKLYFGVGDKHALATRMTIDSSGNVGIGTTSPSSKLQVDGNIKLNDTYRLKIGDSDDLQVYHDGSNSYIKENGTGNLRIDASNFYVRNSGGTKIAIDALDGAEVALRYDNVRKLETTSTGVEVTGNINVSGSVQRQISTTHHTFTFGAAGSASQDYWVPFIGSSELAAPNVTHRTIAPYGGILKKAIVHSTAAYGSSAQVRFHRIDNGTSSVFTNDNSTDDVTTNVTADMRTAYTSVAFDFTTGNTFSAGDQIGVSFVRNSTGLGDVAITLVWEYELF